MEEKGNKNSQKVGRDIKCDNVEKRVNLYRLHRKLTVSFLLFREIDVMK